MTKKPDLIAESYNETVPVGTHGGKRANAGGRKNTKEEIESVGDPYLMLAVAKARHEAIKADLAELTYREKAGELLNKSDVEIAASRLHSFLAQSLRNLPDDMERRCGLNVEQVQLVQDYIDALTTTLGTKLNEF